MQTTGEGYTFAGIKEHIMQREIKFRAWHPEKKAMLIDFDQESVQNFPLTIGDSIHNAVWQIGLNYGTLMQFIGLLDTKGREIYEGDIVNAWGGQQWQGVWEISVKGVIEYSLSASFSIVKQRTDKPPIHYDFSNSDWDGIQVIGNIYQNPELLTT